MTSFPALQPPRRVSLVGTSGSGKTTTMGDQIRANPRSIALDPIGSSTTKRTLIDWVDQPIHIDELLDQDQVDQVIRYAGQQIDQGNSVGLDLGDLVGDDRGQLGDRIGRALLRYIQDCVIVIDEAQWFMPQGSFRQWPGLPEVIGKGRNYGHVPVLSAHRFPAVEKNAVDLTNTWIIMKVEGKTNLNDVRGYLTEYLSPEDLDVVMRTLPTLQPGQYYVFGDA